jgi:hypothetical protein
MKKYKNIQSKGIWRQTDRQGRTSHAGSINDFGFYTDEFHSTEIGLDGKGGGEEDYRTVVKTLYDESTELFMLYKPTETPFNPSHKLFTCIYL